MYKLGINRPLLIIIGLVAMTFIILLVVMKKDVILPSKSVSGVEPFKLNKTEVENLQRQADAGNVEAAKRLRDYYAFVILDDKQTLHWAKRAVELGDTDSQRLVEYYEKEKKLK